MFWKMVALSLIMAALITGALEMRGRGGAGGIDPFAMTPLPASLANADTLPYIDTKSKTLSATQTLSPAVRNLVILIAGQSNITDVTPSAYTPTNPTKIDNFNVYDGATYAAVDPLLGTSRIVAFAAAGHPIMRVADSLITNNKFDRVVLVPLAIDATLVADWATGFASEYISKAMRRLAVRGMISGANITVILLWGQGESDSATAGATYTSSLNTVIANARAAGTIDRIFIATQTWNGSAVVAAIQTAQANCINHGTGIWEGANADALIGTACGGVACRQADVLHWSDAGAPYYAGTSGTSGWLQGMTASGAPF